MIAFSLSRLARLVVLVVLGGALLGLTGCVSMDEYKRVENAANQFKRQLAEADNEINGLQKQLDSLNAQIAQQGSMAAGYNALKQDRDLLAARLAKLQADYDDLLAKGVPTIPGPVNDALQKLADQYPDLLEYDARAGMIRFKSDMTFDLGSTDVKPRAKEALKVLAGILNNPLIAKNEVRVVGHTDDVPIRATTAMTMNPTNWYLSTNRAHAVREVLTVDGVADTRMQAAGWGETRPIAPNAAGHKGSEKNRRVEVFILPTEVPENAIDARSDSMRGAGSTPPRAPATRPARPRTPVTPTPGVPTPMTPLGPTTPSPEVPLPR